MNVSSRGVGLGSGQKVFLLFFQTKRRKLILHQLNSRIINSEIIFPFKSMEKRSNNLNIQKLFFSFLQIDLFLSDELSISQKNATVPVNEGTHVDQDSESSSDEHDILDASRDRSNAMVFDRSLVGGKSEVVVF
jgi:hypothetical protein